MTLSRNIECAWSTLETLLSWSAPRFYRGIPDQVWAVVGSALAGLPELVSELREADVIPPDAVRHAAAAVGAYVDDHLDEIPGWSSLDEQQRDQIIVGVIASVDAVCQAVPQETDPDRVAVVRTAVATGNVAPLMGPMVGRLARRAPRRARLDL